ncbi:MAG: cysteine desulfurase family protein [Vicinamibacteria bacterium]
MTEDIIYLDHNATTPMLPEVVDAMLPFLRHHFGNPSSSHPLGRAAREAVGKAREQVAALIGSDPDEIVFTSGGTESNNLAIRGVSEARPDRRHIVSSLVEHPAVAAPCAWLERHGWRVTRVGVDGDGRVVVAEAVAALGPQTALVTIMLANNETGVLQPVQAVAGAARQAGAIVHTDAAQAVGKVPVDVGALGVDLLTIAGHKLYAPKGVGALYVRRGTPLRPFVLGAGHEGGLRPGTENVASIAGLGVACERARLDLASESARVRALRDRLWHELHGAVPGLALNGHSSERLPNTLSVRFPGVSGSALLEAAPAVAASTGSACHAGQEQAPGVVVAMGVASREALGTVRLSLGRGTSEVEVLRAAQALSQAWQRLSRR